MIKPGENTNNLINIIDIGNRISIGTQDQIEIVSASFMKILPLINNEDILINKDTKNKTINDNIENTIIDTSGIQIILKSNSCKRLIGKSKTNIC